MRRRKHSTYKRYYRKEYIRSKKPFIIIGAIALVLLIAAAVFLYINNKNNEEKVYYSEMEECSLPTLTMDYNGQPINRMYGYLREMDPNYMRDSIFVLDYDYDITIEAQLYGNTVRALEFSLTDLNNDKLIQRQTVSDYTLTGDSTMTARLRLENMIEENEEYFLDIKLTDGNNREIHYYSRVIKESTTNMTQSMALVLEHHNAMYNGDKDDILADYQTPNSAANDSTNYGDISLYSTLGSMTWGSMDVSEVEEPIVSIIDVDNDIAFFRLDYQVTRTTEEGNEEYYNVSEYYKTRIYGEKKYILSYERSVDEIFIPEASQIGNKSVQIGIASDLDIQTMTNAAGNMNVFVADKAVWFMDTDTKTLQKVFSFETDPTDIRQNYNQHDIELLKVTDDGDFEFIVYGYMNRGMHEGQAGIGLYTYSAEKDEVQEDIFIPSNLPYQILKNSIGSLCYLNDSNIFYILLDEYVYALNPSSHTARLVVSGLNENNFKVSDDGRMLAWQDDGKANDAVKINVMDLATGDTYSVEAEAGKCIKALGFLNQDLVYGVGDEGKTYVTAEGAEYLLMTDLYVIDKDKNVLISENSSEGYYVTSIVEYNRVVVNRVSIVGNDYKEAQEFTLFATDIEEKAEAEPYNTYNEDKRTINYIEVAKTMDANVQATINDSMKITLCSEETTDVSDMLSDEGKYYVYAAGNLNLITTNPAEAIMSAYYATGVVVTSDGYFYKRSSRPNESELTATSINNAVDSYNSGTALNITGIYLNQALYYTGRKIPVIWEDYDITYVIYGYDLYDNLMLYNIDTGEKTLVAYDDVDEIFDITGRCFIYVQ